MTEIEDTAIAAPATHGGNEDFQIGKNNPAATGIAKKNKIE